MSTARCCVRCSLTLVNGQEIGAGVRLARIAAVRSNTMLHDRCPDCSTRLTRLALEWEGIGSVRIEECSYCGVLVVDDDELKRLASIAKAARALDDEVADRLVELARDSLPPEAP